MKFQIVAAIVFLSLNAFADGKLDVIGLNKNDDYTRPGDLVATGATLKCFAHYATTLLDVEIKRRSLCGEDADVTATVSSVTALRNPVKMDTRSTGKIGTVSRLFVVGRHANELPEIQSSFDISDYDAGFNLSLNNYIAYSEIGATVARFKAVGKDGLKFKAHSVPMLLTDKDLRPYIATFSTCEIEVQVTKLPEANPCF